MTNEDLFVIYCMHWMSAMSSQSKWEMLSLWVSYHLGFVKCCNFMSSNIILEAIGEFI
ncbi:unnamed protein product [Moneuplotes crassus]|uniref:Uncharacterized protein n=1 Tax=Euplotes crassus TaxID=5936 RepID=A0AAD1Y3V9_EUPCR|nr:unnamed protein product [Moneuplotes crassus]